MICPNYIRARIRFSILFVANLDIRYLPLVYETKLTSRISTVATFPLPLVASIFSQLAKVSPKILEASQLCPQLDCVAQLSRACRPLEVKSLTSIRAAPSDTCRVSARCSAASALARNILISCSVISVLQAPSPDCLSWLYSRQLSTMKDHRLQLACKVSMSSPTDSICSGGGGTATAGGDDSGDGDTDGGSDGEGDLDLLRDEDGKSDGDDDDGKSGGGNDDDGKSGGGDVGISFLGRRAKARLVGRGRVGGERKTDVKAI
ncbi:hypothetical protein Tco_0317380 [Tanacetum coccineum]